MDMYEFLSQFDKELEKYTQQAKHTERTSKTEDTTDHKVKKNNLPDTFYQQLYMCMTNGTSANTLVNIAAESLFEDPAFRNLVTNLMHYVISITIAALISDGYDREKKKEENKNGEK